MISQLPEKPKTIALLFSSSIHGWKLKDWQEATHGKAHTLTIIQSTKGLVSGGYVSIPCDHTLENKYRKDEKAFVFSVSHQLKFESLDPAKSIAFGAKGGLQFGSSSLRIMGAELINAPNNGWCRTRHSYEHENFNIPTDSEGNSILTGDGKDQTDDKKKFTIAAIETWAINY